MRERWGEKQIQNYRYACDCFTVAVFVWLFRGWRYSLRISRLGAAATIVKVLIRPRVRISSTRQSDCRSAVRP